MQSISRKLDILVKLTEHLQTIEPDNEHSFDLSSAVFRGRAKFGQDDPVPIISILENPRPNPPSAGGKNAEAHIEQWSLLLQGWTKDNDDNPTDEAYLLLAVVERKLAEIISVNGTSGRPTNPSAYLLGNLISDLELGSPVVRPPEENVSQYAFFYMPLTIKIARVIGTY